MCVYVCVYNQTNHLPAQPTVFTEEVAVVRASEMEGEGVVVCVSERPYVHLWFVCVCVCSRGYRESE